MGKDTDYKEAYMHLAQDFIFKPGETIHCAYDMKVTCGGQPLEKSQAKLEAKRLSLIIKADIKAGTLGCHKLLILLIVDTRIRT